VLVCRRRLDDPLPSTVGSVRSRSLSGIDALTSLTTLAQRARLAHPTAGVIEAADLHWWWRVDQRTDADDCRVWFDDEGPTAAVFATHFADEALADVVRLPGHTITPDLVDAARALAGRHGPLSWGCSDDDVELAAMLAEIGATRTGETMVASWMPTSAAGELPLPLGYRVERRSQHPAGTPHHLVPRSGDDVAARLAEVSLYRADLDLLVRAPDDTVAAYALFWADPVTLVGLVEPVRVEDGHAGRGIARALVAHGVRELGRAGCPRAKVSSTADNAAAGRVYASVGFVPVTTIRDHRTGA
jgi:GNAT superfamily N-acetyltransferase